MHRSRESVMSNTSPTALLLNVGHEDAATTFRHYHRLASQRAAKTFWSIRPSRAARGKIVSFATG